MRRMALLRSITAFVLALMLGVTSLTLASARGQAAAVGQVEICSGLGLQVISVDADGNPVGDPHICPDGVAAFVSVSIPVPEMGVRLQGDGERIRIARAVDLATDRAIPARARAPPVFV